jgi:hypothetical protein
MKTLNGYEVVDAQAREDIKELLATDFATETYVDNAIENAHKTLYQHTIEIQADGLFPIDDGSGYYHDYIMAIATIINTDPTVYSTQEQIASYLADKNTTIACIGNYYNEKTNAEYRLLKLTSEDANTIVFWYMRDYDLYDVISFNKRSDVLIFDHIVALN